MARSVNGAGVAFARACISSGKVNKAGAWTFSAEDGNALLGSSGDDWTNYGKYFLAINPGEAKGTKAYYSYPVGKGGEVYRSGVIAVKQRAAAQNDSAIEAAADSLLSSIDGKSSASSATIEDRMEFKSPSLDDFKLAPMGTDESQLIAPGTFSGYLARYGNMDDGGDVIAHGAFADSIAKSRATGQMPYMLLNHGGMPWGAVTTESMMPVGIWDEMHEDQNGLAVTGRIDPMDTDTGRKIYAGMRNRTLSGLSVGYRAQDFVRGTKAGEPKRLITKASLFEGSIVLWPANELATIDSVKSGVIGTVAQAKAALDEEFDPRNPRHLDKLLREAGLSRAEVKAIAATGFKGLNRDAPRDADAQSALSGLLADLKSALKVASP
jgi:HK97 family phage prohead protease